MRKEGVSFDGFSSNYGVNFRKKIRKSDETISIPTKMSPYRLPIIGIGNMSMGLAGSSIKKTVLLPTNGILAETLEPL